MNAKEYLSQAYLLDQRINNKLSQKEHLKSQTMKVTASYKQDKVSSTKQKSPMEEAIIKTIILEQEINKNIDELYRIKIDMTIFISEIEEPLNRLLIDLRYIQGKRWDDIADYLGYNVRWVHKLHLKALKEADTLLQKKEIHNGTVTNPI